jgi:hypothetical protein
VDAQVTGEAKEPTVPLESLREGMTVVDANGQEVGTIGLVRFGDASAGATSEPPVLVGAGSIVTEGRTEPFVPDGLRDWLLRLGYVRVDDKLRLRRDHHYYVLPHEIVAVDGDTVKLATPKGELLQPA